MKQPFFRSLLFRALSVVGGGSLSSPPDWLKRLYGVPVSAGEIVVNPQTAMSIAAFNAAVRVISEDLAALPRQVYRRVGERGKEKFREHPAYALLHTRPHPWYGAFVFWRWMISQTLLKGNAYAEIVRDGGGRPVQLWPLVTDSTRPVISTNPETGEQALMYETLGPDGVRTVLLDAADVFHLRGLGDNPLLGIPVHEHAARSLGLAINSEEYASSFFNKLGQMSGVLSHPKSLNDKAATRLKDSIQQAHAGTRKAFSLLLLEEDMKFTPTSVGPEVAQLLESRKFTVTEIARWFRCPPHKLGDLERATFSNIEQQELSYVVNTLLPWIKQLEEEADLKLLTETERETIFTKLNVDGMLRGDFKTRMDGYAVGRGVGLFSINDMREMEDMNPIEEGGDVYLIPMNMIPAEKAKLLPIQNASKPSGDGAPNTPSRALPTVAESAVRVRGAQSRLFAEAAERLAKREADAILRAQKKSSGTGEQLETFYADFAQVLRRTFEPLALSFAETVLLHANADITRASIVVDTGAIERAAGAAIEPWAAAYCAESQRLLVQAMAAGQREFYQVMANWSARAQSMQASALAAAQQLAELTTLKPEIALEVAA